MTLWVDDDVVLGLEEMIARLGARGVSVRERTWVRGNDAFPVRATTSLNVTGPPWDDDVVLSADIKAVGADLVFESDISDGDGQILVEGPGSRSTSRSADPEHAGWARECLRQYLDFVTENLSIIEQTLEKRASR